MMCDTENCGQEAVKFRGYKPLREAFCLGCYAAATARPGSTPVVTLPRPPEPPPTPAALALPTMLTLATPPVVVRVPTGATMLAEERRRLQRERAARVLAWAVPGQTFVARDVMGLLGCSMDSAAGVLGLLCKAGKMRSLPGRGYEVAAPGGGK